MSSIDNSAIQARDLFLSEYQGILCTNSQDVEGYPFGSVIPFMVNQQGLPLILTSTIAQHTNNMISDKRVSLIAIERDVEDIQTGGRITYMGDVRKLEDDEDSFQRYYNFFPEHKKYHNTHNFDFFVIDLVKARYIGGFGKIFWVSPERFIKPNPFSMEEEQKIIDHMNQDHADSLKSYCDLYNIHYSDSDEPVLVGVDAEGFHIRINARIHRIRFENDVNTTTDVRKEMVALSRRTQAA